MDEFHTFSLLRAQSMLLVAVLLCAVRTWKHWAYFYEFHVVESRDDGQGFSLLSAAFFGLLFRAEALVCQLTSVAC